MKTYIFHIWKALNYSLDGLISTFRNEKAFQIELILASILVPVSLILPLKGIEKMMLVCSVLMLLLLELLNTALESTIDRVSTETHHLSKRAKDAGSDGPDQFIILGATWFTICSDLFLNRDLI